MPKLILASQSPRRRELLELLGVEFTAQAADIDETMDPALSPAEAVAAVSRKKAAAIAALSPADAVVLSADTAVVVDGQILGKPAGAADAARMLSLLAGKTHEVITAMTLRQGGREKCETSIAKVRVRSMSPAEIDAYVQTGEPMDKAGAYAIQGVGGLFIESIEGDYYTVMGLPLCRLGLALREFGISVLGV